MGVKHTAWKLPPLSTGRSRDHITGATSMAPLWPTARSWRRMRAPGPCLSRCWITLSAGRAPLLRELGIDPAKVRYPMTVRLEVEPGTRLARPMPLHFEVGDE